VSLCASGTLDASSAPLLAAVIEGHVRNRRRFIRMDVAELTVDGEEAVAVLAGVHRQLLDVRGTLVLTSVREPLYATLAGAGVASELFLVAPTAFERGDCPV
jgi:anti-anti-sigma regulatory factor